MNSKTVDWINDKSCELVKKDNEPQETNRAASDDGNHQDDDETTSEDKSQK